MADATKSHDARTIWEVGNDGCLTEIGPSSQKYVIPVLDVERLLELLKRNEDRIHRLASEERKTVYGIAPTYTLENGD
jgi:hypothetical protein